MDKKFSAASGIVVLFFAALICFGCSEQGQAQEIAKLNAVEFQQKLSETTDRTLIDVRTPEEFSSGHIEDASNLDIYDTAFSSKLSTIDKNKPVFVYCKAGSRSADAAKQMKQMGFTAVYDLKGGVMAWDKNNLPLINSAASIKDKFTRADYNRLLSDNKNLFIDYYAEWCVPCKQMEPTLAKLEKKHGENIRMVRINVDEAKELIQELNITEIPVVAIYQNGKEVKRTTGYQTEKALQKLLSELK